MFPSQFSTACLLPVVDPTVPRMSDLVGSGGRVHRGRRVPFLCFPAHDGIPHNLDTTPLFVHNPRIAPPIVSWSSSHTPCGDSRDKSFLRCRRTICSCHNVGTFVCIPAIHPLHRRLNVCYPFYGFIFWMTIRMLTMIKKGKGRLYLHSLWLWSLDNFPTFFANSVVESWFTTDADSFTSN